MWNWKKGHDSACDSVYMTVYVTVCVIAYVTGGPAYVTGGPAYVTNLCYIPMLSLECIQIDWQ